MKEKNLISIGEMAKMNRITIPTLRIYDEKDLLRPRYVDEETGYRYYDINQNARLDMIAYMKEMGMSLSEIGDVFSKGDILVIEDILNRKKDQIYQQIDLLKQQRDAVLRAIYAIERYCKSPSKGTITLEYIERRYIFGIPCISNFYNDVNSFEENVVELRSALNDAGYQQIHTYNIGTSILKEDYLRAAYVPRDIFIFTSHNDNHQGVKVVDSGMYACIYLDDFDDEIPCAEKLRNYCEENHYQIAGDYICEIMTEFNVFDSNTRSMFMRLQVPLRFN